MSSSVSTCSSQSTPSRSAISMPTAVQAVQALQHECEGEAGSACWQEGAALWTGANHFPCYWRCSNAPPTPPKHTCTHRHTIPAIQTNSKRTGERKQRVRTFHVERLQHKQLVVAGLVEESRQPRFFPDPARYEGHDGGRSVKQGGKDAGWLHLGWQMLSVVKTTKSRWPPICLRP
jgi:hypothetical protein